MWAYVADPALAGFERLFFALYARALHGDVAARPLLEGDIEAWLEANVALTAAAGVSSDVARTHARLGLAVVRGLLLDLLATGEPRRRRRRARGLRRQLRGTLVGASVLGLGHHHERPRFVVATVARAPR